MFNSLEAIVGRIQLGINDGVQTDDTPFNDEFIADLVHKERAAIVNTIKRNATIQDDFYQEICCLQIKCTDASCTDYPLQTKYYIEVPAIAQSLGMRALRKLSVGDNIYYNEKAYRNLPNTYKIQGNRIYFKGVMAGFKYACVEALFYNPSEPYSICGTNSEEKMYACPSEYITHIEARVIDSIKRGRIFPADKRNDAQQ